MKTGHRSEYERIFFHELRENQSGVIVIPTLETKKGNIEGEKIKNFDFLVGASKPNKKLHALDIKGKQMGFWDKKTNSYQNRFDTYVQTDEPSSLLGWSNEFKDKVGIELIPLFVFMFKIMDEERDAKEFTDILEVDGTKYGILACEPDVYLKHSKPRSKKFDVITVSRRILPEISRPLSSFIPSLRF